MSDVPDGATIMIAGFGESGVPSALIDALIEHGATGLTVITNNAGSGERGVAALFRADRVRRVICSYPRSSGSVWFERRYAEGTVELELVPQGTLSERIRAAAAGLPAFYTPTATGTELARGKETRSFGGRDYLPGARPAADVALDPRAAGRSLGQPDLPLGGAELRADHGGRGGADSGLKWPSRWRAGDLDPEQIITPGIYVDRVVWAAAS